MTDRKNPIFLLKLPVIAILSILCLSACTLFDPPSRPKQTQKLPAKYVEPSGNASQSGRWWKEFNSPELNRLIRKALSSNLNLKQAWARLKQAKASAIIAGAGQFPDLKLNSDVSHARQREKTQTVVGQKTQTSYKTGTVKERSLGLVSQYELDLWGRIRAGKKSTLHKQKVSRRELESAAMSVTAEVATNWVRLVYERKREKLLKKQLKTNKKYLQLTKLRFANGMNTALDVLQQKENLKGTKARLPLSDSAQDKYIHKLALLLGRGKSSLPQSNRDSLPHPGPPPDTGIPANLLSQRPDIRAAWNRLRQADWEVSAAKANLLPRITLTAKHRYSSPQLNTLFNTWIRSLAGGLTAPIFQGGELMAELDRSQGVVAERLHAYRETVFTAIKEVEDALSEEYAQRKYIQKLRDKLSAARFALKEARSQYINGMNTYLPVLNELLSAQNIELDLLDARKDLLVYRIGLYRALGGTWAEKLSPAGLTGKKEGQ